MNILLVLVSAALEGVRSESEHDPNFRTLTASIPGGGVPGIDYPILSSVPDTDFSCGNYGYPGYFADTSKLSRCQVYHICQDGNRDNAFLCPNGTLFSEKLSVCEWWYNVQCVPLGHDNSRVRYSGNNAKDLAASGTTGGDVDSDMHRGSQFITEVNAYPSALLGINPSLTREVPGGDKDNVGSHFSIHHQPNFSSGDVFLTGVHGTLTDLHGQSTSLYGTDLLKRLQFSTSYEVPITDYSVSKVSDGFKLALDLQTPEYSRDSYTSSPLYQDGLTVTSQNDFIRDFANHESAIYFPEEIFDDTPYSILPGVTFDAPTSIASSISGVKHYEDTASVTPILPGAVWYDYPTRTVRKPSASQVYSRLYTSSYSPLVVEVLHTPIKPFSENYDINNRVLQNTLIFKGSDRSSVMPTVIKVLSVPETYNYPRSAFFKPSVSEIYNKPQTIYAPTVVTELHDALLHTIGPTFSQNFPVTELYDTFTDSIKEATTEELYPFPESIYQLSPTKLIKDPYETLTASAVSVTDYTGPTVKPQVLTLYKAPMISSTVFTVASQQYSTPPYKPTILPTYYKPPTNSFLIYKAPMITPEVPSVNDHQLNKAPHNKEQAFAVKYAPPIDALLMHIVIQENASKDDDDDETQGKVYQTPTLPFRYFSDEKLTSVARSPANTNEVTRLHLQTHYSTTFRESPPKPFTLYGTSNNPTLHGNRNGDLQEAEYAKDIINDNRVENISIIEVPLFRETVLGELFERPENEP